MNMINMLCRDFKLPAQQLIQTLMSIDAYALRVNRLVKGLQCREEKLSSKRKDQSNDIKSRKVGRRLLSLSTYISEAKQCSSTLNDLVDSLLLLNKIEEGRFTMHFEDSLHIATIVTEMLHLLSESINTKSIPKSFWYMLCLVNVDAIPASCCVKSENQCIKLLVYHSLLALLSLMCDDNIDENLDKVFESFYQGHDVVGAEIIPWFTMRAELVGEHKENWKSENLDLKDGLFLKMNISVEIPSSAGMSESKYGNRILHNPGGMFESACLICNKVACALNGAWKFSGKQDYHFLHPRKNESARYLKCHGEVEFLMPCRAIFLNGNVSDNSMDSITSGFDDVSPSHGNIPTGRVYSNSEVVNSLERFMETSAVGSLVQPGSPINEGNIGIYSQEEFDQELSLPLQAHERRVARNVIASKTFIFLTDVSFESIMMDILHKLKIKSNNLSDIPMLRTLTIAEMKIYEVAFVHSIESCMEVRKKQFTGQIVLFCERVAYLDEDEKRQCDYIVPIPASDSDLTHLLQFLFDVSLKKDGLLMDELRRKGVIVENRHSTAESFGSRVKWLVQKVKELHFSLSSATE